MYSTGLFFFKDGFLLVDFNPASGVLLKTTKKIVKRNTKVDFYNEKKST